jgi:hypothetical protein
MNIHMIECETLEKEMTIRLPSLNFCETLTSFQFYHLEKSLPSNDGRGKLFLDSLMKENMLSELAVALIMTAIRIEVALLTLNQQVEFMDQLSTLLTKLSKADSNIFLDLLKYDNLQDYVVSTEGTQSWTIRDDVLSEAKDEEEETESLEDATVASVSSTNQRALEGYKMLNEKATQEFYIKSSRPRNTATSQINEEYTQQLELQRMKNARLAQEVLDNIKINNGVIITDNEPSKADPIQLTTIIEYDKRFEPSKGLMQVNESNNSVISSGVKVMPNLDGQIDRILVDTKSSHKTVNQSIPNLQFWVVGENLTSKRARKSNDEYRTESSAFTPSAFDGTNAEDFDAIDRNTDESFHNPLNTHSRQIYRNDSGASVFHSSMLSGPPVSDFQFLDIDTKELQLIIDNVLNYNPQFESLTPEYQDASPVTSAFVKNDASGRIGEQIAVNCLRNIFLSSTADSSINPFDCVRIEWCNEFEESGYPFDILLTYRNGTTKRCEVKTHSINWNQQLNILDWPISPKEILAAQQDVTNYFCVLIKISRDMVQHTLSVYDIQLVGYESGLLNSLYSDNTNLFLRINYQNL